MKVFVNETAIVIFKGAKAKDAIVKYCVKNNLASPKFEQLKIRDDRGHLIGEDATLADQQKIQVNI